MNLCDTPKSYYLSLPVCVLVWNWGALHTDTRDTRNMLQATYLADSLFGSRRFNKKIHFLALVESDLVAQVYGSIRKRRGSSYPSPAGLGVLLNAICFHVLSSLYLENRRLDLVFSTAMFFSTPFHSVRSVQLRLCELMQ